jgi:hypothetical protein
VKSVAKVSAWSAAAVAVLFLGAWLVLSAVGANRHEQGAVFLGIYGLAVAVGLVAVIKTALRVRHERASLGDQ